jgi:hypothetical protein
LYEPRCESCFVFPSDTWHALRLVLSYRPWGRSAQPSTQ